MSARVPRTAAIALAIAALGTSGVASSLPASAIPVAGVPAADDAPYTGPTSTPDDAAIAASVLQFEVDGSVLQFEVDGSVLQFEVGDSVTELRKETSTAKQVVVTVNSDVLFDFGKATLTSGATAEIDATAARVPKGGAVTVDGYTDSIGTPAANLVLSRQRAQAVADRLRKTRPDIRPAAVGHGEADPVAPNSVGGKDSPDGRARNRRVVVTFGR